MKWWGYVHIFGGACLRLVLIPKPLLPPRDRGEAERRSGGKGCGAKQTLDYRMVYRNIPFLYVFIFSNS